MFDLVLNTPLQASTNCTPDADRFGADILWKRQKHYIYKFSVKQWKSCSEFQILSRTQAYLKYFDNIYKSDKVKTVFLLMVCETNNVLRNLIKHEYTCDTYLVINGCF